MLKKSDYVEEFTWWDDNEGRVDKADRRGGQRVTVKRGGDGTVSGIAVGNMGECMPMWQLKTIVKVLRELGVEV